MKRIGELHERNGKTDAEPHGDDTVAEERQDKQADKRGDQVATDDVPRPCKRALRQGEEKNAACSKWCDQENLAQILRQHGKQPDCERATEA
ncbi:hypothetical protein GCM10023069_16430 [Shinella granuli]